MGSAISSSSSSRRSRRMKRKEDYDADITTTSGGAIIDTSTMMMEKVLHIVLLPREILTGTFNYLESPDEIVEVSLVCKDFYNACHDAQIIQSLQKIPTYEISPSTSNNVSSMKRLIKQLFHHHHRHVDNNNNSRLSSRTRKMKTKQNQSDMSFRRRKINTTFYSYYSHLKVNSINQFKYITSSNFQKTIFKNSKRYNLIKVPETRNIRKINEVRSLDVSFPRQDNNSSSQQWYQDDEEEAEERWRCGINYNCNVCNLLFIFPHLQQIDMSNYSTLILLPLPLYNGTTLVTTRIWSRNKDAFQFPFYNYPNLVKFIANKSNFMNVCDRHYKNFQEIHMNDSFFHTRDEITPYWGLFDLSTSSTRTTTKIFLYFNSVQRLSIKNAKLVYAMGDKVRTIKFPQIVLINYVRNAPSTLKWLRSDLSKDNIRMLQKERPDIEFVS